MGFSHASRPEAVSTLLEEVDTSRSGFVGEREFIEYFKCLRRADIAARLAKFTSEDVLIQAVTYSASTGMVSRSLTC
jgi:hypothetical protein